MADYPIFRKEQNMPNQEPSNPISGVLICAILCATLVAIVYIIWG